MKLASSSKPVRVCDKCHTLLQKSTVTTGLSDSVYCIVETVADLEGEVKFDFISHILLSFPLHTPF